MTTVEQLGLMLGLLLATLFIFALWIEVSIWLYHNKFIKERWLFIFEIILPSICIGIIIHYGFLLTHTTS